jgi:hypothetical protein
MQLETQTEIVMVCSPRMLYAAAGPMGTPAVGAPLTDSGATPAAPAATGPVVSPVVPPRPPGQ